MATLDELPRMLQEDPQVREDFLSTLSQFCKRHGIDAAPSDFVGLAGEGSDDTAGHVARVNTQGLQVFIYRDGPRYSRWIDSG
jgi:hypothetical protein